MRDSARVLSGCGLKFVEREVEPLRLLQVSSRNRTLVAAWNGSCRDGTLFYAEPGHPEFTQFPQIEAIVITVAASAIN